MKRIEVPVLIVGGGVAGLTCSMLLARLGVKARLVTYFPGTSPQPKAHIINQRTMEIFTELGVADAIYKVSTPPQAMKYAGWYAGVGGSSPYHGREIGRVEAWGAGGEDPDYLAASPCLPANYPQMYLEPILKAHAETLAPDGLFFYQELVEFSQDEDGVTAVIRNRADDECYEVRCRYLLAADAGKTVGPRLGIEMQSSGQSMRMSSVHFSADLSTRMGGSDVLTRFLINPDFGGSWASGVLLPEGPTRWGNTAEEWVYHSRYLFGDDAPLDAERVLARMYEVLGISPDEVHVHHVSEWVMGGFLASRYQDGRIFLVGDACKKHPPTGGLGLNSAVQDAYNLCWKVAHVLQGRASEALLETYELERRPVAQRNVSVALGNAMQHFLIDAAIGLSEENSKEENWRRLKQVWDTSPETEPVRVAVANAIAKQRIGFRHHNIEFGYTYDQGALVSDASPAVQSPDPVLLYQPSTRPGHPLPHAWLSRLGQVVPIASFVEGGHFVVLAGEEGQPWVRAAEAVGARLGLSIRAVRVGLYDGDYLDLRGSWARHRGIGPEGVILVRPDRYVAYRQPVAVDDPEQCLEHVLRQILSTH